MTSQLSIFSLNKSLRTLDSGSKNLPNRSTKYLSLINFRASLIFVQHDSAKTNIPQNKPFFAYLGAWKLIVRKFLKFLGIRWYFTTFSDSWFYPIHLSVDKPEKKNPTETCKVVLVSQVNSYKHKKLSVVSLTSDNKTLKICILKPYGSYNYHPQTVGNFCLPTENT